MARQLILCSCGLLLCSLFTGALSNSTISTLAYLNLTVCEFNISSNYFVQSVEAIALAPILSYIIGLQFATTATALDVATFGTLSWYGLSNGAYLMGGFLALCGVIALVILIYKLTINILACRFRLTRRTNFIIGKRGEFVRHSGHVLETDSKGALPSGVVPDRVIINGREAHRVGSVQAEKWSP